MTTTNTTPVTQAEIDAFIAKWQAFKVADLKTRHPSLTAATLSVEPGKRFARIVATDSQRSCVGFIELATGDLYKAATWKAPAKNFTRGNIRTTDPKWSYSIG